jgi:uncharacterized protein (DUF1800 family)
MRNRVVLALCLAMFLGESAYASKKNAEQARRFFKQIPKDQKIPQALNRLTFGPRPGDARQVKAIGLKKWIDLQLHPERIPENPLLDAKLKTLDTLNMSGSEMVRKGMVGKLVARDLAGGKLLRAIYSNRQLDQVLDDFWFNHFNIFLDKGADRFMVTEYERGVIRPRVLGKFRDLLEATAKSPAMLFYLDNWQSVGPNAPQPRGRKGSRGLNENYGRELLELHTLGVDGGYTQQDVTEAARCFTGWTIDQPQNGGTFVFNKRVHDDGDKVFLGVKIPAGGGQSDGEKVLDIVARHPSTAHFISRKLAMRFVADDPPSSLVDRMAQTFLNTDGDLREVMQTMLKSKEFWSEGAYRSKMKSPLEMVASAVRALNGDVDSAFSLVNQVAQLGQPLYRKQEPTGYSNASQEWVNAGGLLARMNFALHLAGNHVPGVKVDAAKAAKPDDPTAGIGLGSPEFQKH